MDFTELKKQIVEEFKKEGLEVAEDVALRMTKVAFRVAPLIITATDTKVDDIVLLPILKVIEGPVFMAIDKIDGHVGA